MYICVCMCIPLYVYIYIHIYTDMYIYFLFLFYINLWHANVDQELTNVIEKVMKIFEIHER